MATPKEKILRQIEKVGSVNRSRLTNFEKLTAEEIDEAVKELIREKEVAFWGTARGFLLTRPGAEDPRLQKPNPKIEAGRAAARQEKRAPEPPAALEVTVTHEISGETASRFDSIIIDRMAKTRHLLLVKGKEYAAGGARFHNFEQGAAFMRCTPERALLGYMSKHLVSIVDMIEARDRGEMGDPAAWGEKIGDAITYLHLLEAMVT